MAKNTVNEILHQTIETLYEKDGSHDRWRSRLTGVPVTLHTSSLLDKACQQCLAKNEEGALSNSLLCEPTIDVVKIDEIPTLNQNWTLTLDPNTHQPFWTDGTGGVLLLQDVIYTCPVSGEISDSLRIAERFKTLLPTNY
jgi:hypothetical protein